MRVFYLVILSLIASLCFAQDLIIKSIHFQGNTQISEKELESTIVSKENSIFNAETANDDALRITGLYEAKGFMFTKVSFPEKVPLTKAELKLIYTINESKINEIDTLIFTGNSYFSDFKLSRHLNPKDESIRVSDLTELKSKILQLYISRGFLFCSVSLDSLSTDYDEVKAHFTISEAKQTRFKKAIFRGNKLSKENSLIKISYLKKDQLLTDTQLNKAMQRIEEKEYIKTCTILPINEETLLFDITEDKMTRLEGVLGFNNTKNKDRFIGYLNFDFMNLFGADKNLMFKWQALNNDRDLIKMRYFDSGPERIPLAFNLGFERESVDSSYIKIISDIDIYTYYNNLQTGINLAFNDINPGSKLLNRIEKDTQKSLAFFGIYNTFDSKYNPTKGVSSTYRYSFYFLDNNKNNTHRFSNEFRIDFAKTVLKNTVLYHSFNYKSLQNKSLNFYDLYSMGGTFSVRGFSENFFTGNRLFWINNEIRFLPDQNSRFFLFLDYAYIEDQRPEIKSNQKNIIGTGLGFRVPSRLGNLRFDYGIHHYQSKWLHPMDGFIHLGLETLF